MKKTFRPKKPFRSRTAATCRFIKKVTIAGVSFLKARDVVMSLTHVGDSLQLVREPDNSHDPHAIRIDRDGYVKLGYIPRKETSVFVEKMDAGTFYTGIITSLQRQDYKIEADIYERVLIPFPDINSFCLKTSTCGGPTTVFTLNLRERQFIYQEQNSPYYNSSNRVELKFSTDYWENVLTRIQHFIFLGWEKDYYRPACDGTHWEITIRRKNKKPLKSSGSNAYPQEWTILKNFIHDCLDLNTIKGHGRFFYNCQLENPL